jgi:hypothetical protein
LESVALVLFVVAVRQWNTDIAPTAERR